MFTKWSMGRTSQKWVVNEMFYQILGELLFVNHTTIYIHLTFQEFLVIVYHKIKIFITHLHLNNIDEPYHLFFLISSQITYLYITHQNINYVNVFLPFIHDFKHLCYIFKNTYKLFDWMVFNMVGCIDISICK